MNRNINEYVRRFYESPDRNPDLPVQQMRARLIKPDKFEALREEEPDWYEFRMACTTWAAWTSAASAIPAGRTQDA